jgi:hypothetical protein
MSVGSFFKGLITIYADCGTLNRGICLEVDVALVLVVEFPMKNEIVLK